MFLLMSAILIQGTEKSRTALKDYLMHQRKYLLPIPYVKQHLALRKKFWLFNAERPLWSDGRSLLLQGIPAVWDPPTPLGATNSLISHLCTNFNLCGNSFDTFLVGNFSFILEASAWVSVLSGDFSTQALEGAWVWGSTCVLRVLCLSPVTTQLSAFVFCFSSLCRLLYRGETMSCFTIVFLPLYLEC